MESLKEKSFLVKGRVNRMETTFQKVAAEKYEEAKALVAEYQTVTVSMLQRRLRIGYNAAATMIDRMEAEGLVGPYDGSKPRKVFLPKPEKPQATVGEAMMELDNRMLDVIHRFESDYPHLRISYKSDYDFQNIIIKVHELNK